MISATADGTSSPTSSPRSSRSRSSREATGVGSISKNATRSGCPSRASTRVEALLREARARGHEEPHPPQHLVRLLPVGQVAELVGADQEVRAVPLGMRSERVDRARVLVEHDLVVRERRARHGEAFVRRRCNVLVTRRCRDEHDEPVDTEDLLRPPGELDVPAVRRVERAAVQRGHASSNSSSPISTLTPRFAPAALSARSSSSSDGGVPSTR